MAMVKNKKPLMTADDEPGDIQVEQVHVAAKDALDPAYKLPAEIEDDPDSAEAPPAGFKGKGYSSVDHPTGASEHTPMETPGKLLSVEPMATVSVSLGQTMNTGNYNSVRIDVGVTIPCPVKDLDATHDYALEWVDEKFGSLRDDIVKLYPAAGK